MQERKIGEYTAGRRLGSGPFCETYLGEHLPTQTRVVLKRVHPALVVVPKICVRLRAQAVSPPHIEHPRIAGLLTILLDRDDIWLVTQHAAGMPFEETLTPPHDPHRIVPAFCRLLEAFDHAHRHGLVHANLKNTNLLFQPGGELRVLDFTTARLFGYSALTRDLLSAGVYRPPEMAEGDDIDARADLYSLGKILLRLLGMVPGPFDSVIRRATAEDRENRFRNVGEFRKALIERLPAPEEHVEEYIPTTLHHTVKPMSIIDRIRKPLQNVFSKMAVVHGHTVEEASVPIPTPAVTPVVLPVPVAAPAPVIVKPKSLKETLASELVEFDLDRAQHPPAKPVSERLAAPAEAPQPVAEEVPDDPVEAGFAAFRSGDLVRARRMWLAAKRVDANNRIIDYNLRVVERKLAASNGR